jgi:hypothetical protein
VVPYVKHDTVPALGRLVLVFQVAAFVIALACTWLLGAEYQRLLMVRKKYEELGSAYEIPRLPLETFWQRLVAKPIGTASSIMFGVGFTLLSITSFGLLF